MAKDVSFFLELNASRWWRYVKGQFEIFVRGFSVFHNWWVFNFKVRWIMIDHSCNLKGLTFWLENISQNLVSAKLLINWIQLISVWLSSILFREKNEIHETALISYDEAWLCSRARLLENLRPMESFGCLYGNKWWYVSRGRLWPSAWKNWRKDWSTLLRHMKLTSSNKQSNFLKIIKHGLSLL